MYLRNLVSLTMQSADSILHEVLFLSPSFVKPPYTLYLIGSSLVIDEFWPVMYVIFEEMPVIPFPPLL